MSRPLHFATPTNWSPAPFMIFSGGSMVVLVDADDPRDAVHQDPVGGLPVDEDDDPVRSRRGAPASPPVFTTFRVLTIGTTLPRRLATPSM